MKKYIAIIILLFGILIFQSSCMHIDNQEENSYHIEGKQRTFKMIGVDGAVIENVRKEFYIADNGKLSAVVIGYGINSKRAVTLYVSENSQVRREQSFPVDDDMEIAILNHVMDEINSKQYTISSLQFSMKTCGITNLNISENYWKTKRLNRKNLQQPLFSKFCDILKKCGYEVYGFSYNDFYPITTRDVGYYHILPDSSSPDTVAIDGIVTLECRKLESSYKNRKNSWD